jgi:hypothetical protein
MFAWLLLTLVVGTVSNDDQAAGGLIPQLAAPSFDDRVAAYKELERLGAAALPALRTAANSSEPRISTRARALIESISQKTDTDRLRQATLIALDFRNRPLSEVVDALNDRHDLRLSLRFDPPPTRGMMGMFPDPDRANRLGELKARPITLESRQPVPFWEAIDQLCQAGKLRYETFPAQPFGSNSGSFLLIADRTGRGPVADFGPFRVQITDVVSEFDRDLVKSGEAAAGQAGQGAGELTVSLLATAEPGMKLELNGAPTVIEAIDEQGRSLVPVGRAQVDHHRPARGVLLQGGPPIARVTLVAPDSTGKLIRRLRGGIPVIATAKAFNSFVVGLQGKSAVGKQISTRSMTLVVNDVSLADQNRPSVQVSIRPHGNGLAARTGAGPRRPLGATFNGGDIMDHLELRDESGKRVNAILGERGGGTDGQGFFSRYRLVVAPVVEDGGVNRQAAANPPVLAELRYHEFVQREIEIPFDFHDIPMP